MAEKCIWDPQKHKGEQCPTHDGSGDSREEMLNDSFDDDYDFENWKDDLPSEGAITPSKVKPESNQYNMTKNQTPDKFSKETNEFLDSLDENATDFKKEFIIRNLNNDLENISSDMKEISANDSLDKDNMKEYAKKYAKVIEDNYSRYPEEVKKTAMRVYRELFEIMN